MGKWMSTPLALLWLALSAGSLFAQSEVQIKQIKVIVLDASSGRPQAEVRLHYWCMPDAVSAVRSDEVTTKTDKDGIAQIPYCKPNENLGIVAVPTDRKEQCGSMPDSLKADRIASEGVVFTVDSDAGFSQTCSKKAYKKMRPVPGQITIFVQKPSWWHSHFPG